MFLQRMPVYKLTPNWPNSWVNWKPWNGMHSCFRIPGLQLANASCQVDICFWDRLLLPILQVLRFDSITSTSPELIFKCSMYFGPAHVHRFAMFWRCGPSCCWLRSTHGIFTGRVANLLWSVILRSPGPEATLCWCHCWRGFQHAAMCWTAWTIARRLASQFRFWNCKRTARNAKCGWYLDFSKLSWHQEPYSNIARTIWLCSCSRLLIGMDLLDKTGKRERKAEEAWLKRQELFQGR